MKRRYLVKQIMAGGTLLLIAPVALTSCEKDDPDNGPGGNNNNNNSNLIIDLTNPEYAALNSVGGHVVKSGIIVINLGSENYVALSAICTHEGCTVAYNSGAGNIQCPCHFSVYNTSGTVLVGPAPSPLQKFTITKSGNILTVVR